MTFEELQAALDAANAELADLREVNGQLQAAAEQATSLKDQLQVSWNNMQLQRNSSVDARQAIARVRDRYAKFLSDVDTIQSGTTTAAQKITALRTAITVVRADLVTLGG